MKANPTGADPPPDGKVTDRVRLEQVLTMNEALTLGAVRQHKLTEEAEKLNVRLREEIRQREEAERALRESESRFRSLFVSAPMAVFACDRDEIIQQCNSGAVNLLGREPCDRERVGESLRLWHPNGEPVLREESPIAEVLRTGHATMNIELQIERADGSHVPVLANFSALKSADGEITGAIASFVDLTERKKLEQHSLRSQRMESIGTLAGGIAHDLNNSLGPITMSLELLRLKFPDTGSQELIGLLQASAKRGADMVRQILSFARGAEGRREAVAVPTLVQEVEHIVNETFLRHIQIRTVIHPDVWMVMGDSTQLYQVLLNLCLNARDAMPNGGSIVVTAENRRIDTAFTSLSPNPGAKAGPYVLLEVRDSGTGMPPHLLEKIFDPFFTTKDFGRGSGLGLSTAMAIVQGHNGFFQVSSQLGEGTTFQVFIPALIQLTSPPLPRSSCGGPVGNGELILVVDDEEPMRQMTQQLLEAFGYRVVVACDGAEAVAIYSRQAGEIAAVITDMTMPVMEGPELIRILRTMSPQLPVIGASGLASTSYAPKLASLGVKHILSKPYTTNELLTLLKQALGPLNPSETLRTPGAQTRI